MASVSSGRMLLSCLPLVGPFVGLYNNYEIIMKAASLPSLRQLNAHAEYLPLFEKSRIYDLSGIIGNVGSLAAVAQLVALGHLSQFNGCVLSGVFTGLTIFNVTDLYNTEKQLEKLKNPLLGTVGNFSIKIN